MPWVKILLLACVQPAKLGELRDLLSCARAHRQSEDIDPLDALRSMLPLQHIPTYPAELADLVIRDDGQLTFGTPEPDLTGSGWGLAQVLAGFVVPGSALAIVTSDAGSIDIGGWFLAASSSPEHTIVIPLEASLLDGSALEALVLSDMRTLTAPVW